MTAEVPPNALLVEAAGRRFGLPLEAVTALVEPGRVYPVPAASPAVRGVIAVDRHFVPLADLAALVTPGARLAAPGEQAVVVRYGGMVLALEVDAAHDVLQSPLLPAPADGRLPWVLGVMAHGEGHVPLLDLKALVGRLLETP